MACIGNHKFKVNISGLYLKNDRISSLLIHPAGMHHSFSPNLIRNTSAMFIFLCKSEKHRKDLGLLFHTPLTQGGGGSRLQKSKTSDPILTTPRVLLLWPESTSNAVHKCHLAVTRKVTRKNTSLSRIKETFFPFYLNKRIFLHLPFFFLGEIITFISFYLFWMEVSGLIFCHSVLQSIKCGLGFYSQEAILRMYPLLPVTTPCNKIQALLLTRYSTSANTSELRSGGNEREK